MRLQSTLAVCGLLLARGLHAGPTDAADWKLVGDLGPFAPDARRRHDALPVGLGTLQVTPAGAFMFNVYHDSGKSGYRPAGVELSL